jgi:hypothetical protein
MPRRSTSSNSSAIAQPRAAAGSHDHTDRHRDAPQWQPPGRADSQTWLRRSGPPQRLATCTGRSCGERVLFPRNVRGRDLHHVELACESDHKHGYAVAPAARRLASADMGGWHQYRVRPSDCCARSAIVRALLCAIALVIRAVFWVRSLGDRAMTPITGGAVIASPRKDSSTRRGVTLCLWRRGARLLRCHARR